MAPLHAFGQRYALPAPLSLYLLAGAAVVVLSFVLVAAFSGAEEPAEAETPAGRQVHRLSALTLPRALRVALGMVGVAGWLGIVVTGLAGPQQAARSPAEYLLWIYFWAGLVILVALLGNFWEWLNPWAAIYDATAGAGGARAGAVRLPDRLGIWPAVAVYFLFACLELTSGLAGRPALIGALTLAYGGLMYVGMLACGRDSWLSRVDAFTVLFRLVGRFGLFGGERGDLRLRWPGAGLLDGWEPGADRVVFVILTLSTLAFDGLLATSVYATWRTWLAGAPEPVERTVGLALLTALFFSAFWLTARTMAALGRAPAQNWNQLLIAFALTLVPIALVYNAAHNYTYLVVQSQALWPLLSDPLGRGWSLWPALAAYRPSFLLANAAAVWYAQMVLIVGGHVIAVYLAHRRAQQEFETPARALVSQYPMLLLMVLYTATSLWILAQPTTFES